MRSAFKWQFASRSRRHAFDWRSDAPIASLNEALLEIKQVGRKEPVRAAEGAVLFLEKLSPALEQVDSSSGALGSEVNKAIQTLVPLIAKADVEARVQQRWFERLWTAIERDGVPYLESPGDFWGGLWSRRISPRPGPMNFSRRSSASGIHAAQILAA
jgi:hypothetical protein